mgnify:FL=1
MSMKKYIPISLIILSLIFVANYIVMSQVFNDATDTPPNGNVPAPINVGPMSQSKEGNLEVGSLTLGGVTRSTWPSGVGAAACNWEGIKCDCSDDSSAFADIRLTIGTSCQGGQIAGVEIVNFEISSGNKNCPDNPHPKCTAGYTHD